MKIEVETKYAIGDQVAAIDSDFVITDGTIDEICIFIYANETYTAYYVKTEGDRKYFRETKVYPSRDAIANYILNNTTA